MKRHFLLLVALASAACSSPSDDDPGQAPADSADLPDAGPPRHPTGQLPEYCTGTTLVDMALLELDAGGRWTKTDEWLPAGRTFYLGHVLDSSHHQAIAGFVVAGDGAHRLEDHDGAGLPRSTFSTDCRLPAYPDRRRFVTLEETVLHRDASASGDPSASSDACRLKLGTTLEDWERDPKSGYATLGGPEVKRACGFSPGYAARLVYGELLLR